MSPTVAKGGRVRWKMDAPCADCPFTDSEAGTHLRKSLAKGRMAEIKRALRNDQHFTCHKTTYETGNGTSLVCAGALAWQEERGLSSQYVRICERLDAAEKTLLRAEQSLSAHRRDVELRAGLRLG